MITKVYDKIKQFLKENWKFLIIFSVLGMTFTYEFPYYIDAPGGLLDVSDKIEIKDSYEVEGSFNLAYVSEIKATIPTLLIALLNPDWDILKEEEVLYDNETAKELLKRDQLLLKEAIGNATIVGFQKAGRKVQLKSEKVYVGYKLEEAVTDLKIGDQIISIYDEVITSKEHLSKILSSFEAGEKIEIKVLENGKEKIKTATLQEIADKKIIGVVLIQINEIETNPTVQFHFSKNESGPSGGFMTALSIYNLLTEEDLTKGYKIVGTGTIEIDGSVGSIGGVKYKLKGAVKKKADIFFVPAGENYEEAMRLKEKHQYNIEIVSIESFDDAIQYLKNK